MRLLLFCCDMSVHHRLPVLYIAELSIFIKIFLRRIWVSFCNPVTGVQRFCLQRFRSAWLHTNLLAHPPVSAQHLLTLSELGAVTWYTLRNPWHQWLLLRHRVKVVFCLVDSSCTILPQSLLVCCQREMLLYSNRVYNLTLFISSQLLCPFIAKEQLSHCMNRFPVSTHN